MSTTHYARYLTGSLFQHVLSLGVTTTVGIAAVLLVDFIDAYFIAYLGQTELVAALGYGSSLRFFCISLGAGIGFSSGALVAHAVGAEDHNQTRSHIISALFWCILGGSAIALASWPVIPKLLGLYDINQEVQAQATSYARIVFLSLPCLLIGMAGGFILRSLGDAKWSMIVTLAGAGANLVLDPIFIFGFDMGLAGAAIATALSQVVMAVCVIWRLVVRYIPKPRFSWADQLMLLRPLAMLAIPTILLQLATPVGQFFQLRVMTPFGSEAVAGLTLMIRLENIAFSPIYGISAAVGPIVAQNYSAKRFDRISTTMIHAVILSAISTALVYLVLFGSRIQIADGLGAQGDAQIVLLVFCGYLSLYWFFNGVLFSVHAALGSMNQASWACALNWGRFVFANIPLMIAGGATFGFLGVIYGQALSGSILAGIGVLILRHANRQQPAPD